MSAAPNPWDDPDFATGGEFVTFASIGDTVTGRIDRIGKKVWDDGSVSPELRLTCPDGSERTVTAGQIRLKAALAEKRPNVGETITITLTDIEKRSGGKTLKHFDVQVGAVAAPAGKKDAGAKYTPEQIKAMKDMGIDVPEF